MTSLAAQKLRQFRSRHVPRLTKVQFGLRYAVTGMAVTNWENGRPPQPSLIKRLFDDGVADPNDWFVPPLPPELLPKPGARAGRCAGCGQSLFSAAALAGGCCAEARAA